MPNRTTVLDATAIETIHSEALRLLNETGIHVPDPECLSALSDAGAAVDGNASVARIPARVVEDALARSGRHFVLYGRDSRKTARFGHGDFVLASSPGQFAWVDDSDVGRREPSSADMQQAALVGDALPHIDLVGGLAMPLDVPARSRDIYTAAQLLKFTTKPAHVWVSGGRNLEAILEMYEAVQGGSEEHRCRPMLQGFVEPVSPLRFAPSGLEILKLCARKGLPLCFGPMVQAGASGPATLAGTLVVENAEILAGIVLAQLFGPGTPVCYGGIPHIFDMRSMQISFGAPEQGLMAVAMTQMARHYGLPAYVNVGLSDSKTMDAQSGVERATTLLLGGLAGADTFGHMGIVGPDQAGSIDQLILDSEIAGYVKRILAGLRVDAETIAAEVIRDVGIGGSFLGETHTREHYRREFWMSALFDRQRWDPWETAGSLSVSDRVRVRRTAILSRHKPDPLPDALGAELDRIVASTLHF
jgi:trimethylamine---corrinoid protein Co-methyltransferase